LDGETKLLSVGAEGGKTYALRTYPTENLATFPKAPAPPEDPGGALVVPFGTLRRAFARVTPFAAAPDASRPLLSATRLSVEAAEGGGPALRAVSTDAYRLGLAEVPVPQAVPRGGEEGDADPTSSMGALEAGVCLPARALTELARAAAALFGADACAATPVSVALSGSAAYFSLGDQEGGGASLRFATSLVAGEYPDYARLLPGSFEREYEIDAAGLASALKRAALFVAAGGAGAGPKPGVTLTALTPEEGGLMGPGIEVTAAAAETGSSRERVDASMKGGAPIEEGFSIHFNPDYLLDAVTAAASTKVLLKANDPLKPAIVAPAGDPPGESRPEARVLVLIQPMRNPAAEAKKGKATPAA
jgi:DNA polymerase III sliding clamp (beta) subunit (PCNA family)